MTQSLLFFLLFTLSIATHSAAFDCLKASTAVERNICADQELSALDEFLASLYLEAKASSFDTKHLVIQQKTWLIERDKCKDKSCLLKNYTDRSNALACVDTGSALGATHCFNVGLKFAEQKLTAAEKQHAIEVLAGSNNPENAVLKLAADSKVWIENRKAKCDAVGEGEGGSEEWKNAFALQCEIDETDRRLSELSGKPMKAK